MWEISSIYTRNTANDTIMTILGEIIQNKQRKLQFGDKYNICLCLSYRSNYGVRFSLLYDITLLLLTICRTLKLNKMACVFVVKPEFYVLVLKNLHH